MIFALRQVYLYFQHFLKSSRLHGIHSPFVFNLYNQVIRHSGNYYVFPDIEKLRRSLYTNKAVIKVNDFGAGSRITNQSTKSLRLIASNAANPPRLAQFLFRLVNFQQPQTILEIGTSLGLTTAYLASAKKQARVFTLEGCPSTAQHARKNLKSLRINNTQVITGNFDDSLPALLPELKTLDFVLFDGNHRYEPTIKYFEWCLSKVSENSVFIFDDIYWSQEMQKAWQQICGHPEVMISIDMFHLGLIFFRKNQPKQHFNIRF